MTWVLDHSQKQDELPSFLLFLHSISSAFFKLHDFSLIRCSKSKEMESGYKWDTTEFVWIIFMLTIGRQTWIQGRIYDIFVGNRREAVTEDWILLRRHLWFFYWESSLPLEWQTVPLWKCIGQGRTFSYPVSI